MLTNTLNNTFFNSSFSNYYEPNNAILAKINAYQKENKNLKEIILTQKNMDELLSISQKISDSKFEIQQYLKNIFNQTSIEETTEIVSFFHNILIIHLPNIEKYIQNFSNTKQDKEKKIFARELLQLLFLIKMHNQKNLDSITLNSEKLPLLYTDDFLSALTYEKKIENTLVEKLNFSEIISFINISSIVGELTEERTKICQTVLNDICKKTLISIENQNLIEKNGSFLFFNEASFEYYKLKSFQKHHKRELLQSLSLILENQINSFSFTGEVLLSKKDEIIQLLINKISQQEIQLAIDSLPEPYKDISEEKTIEILNAYPDNHYFDFESSKTYSQNLNNILLKDTFFKDNVLLYFIIQCYHLKKDFSCSLLDKKNITFSSFSSLFYLEKPIEDYLKNYSINKIFNVLHEFKKDKIFSKENELIVHKIFEEILFDKFAKNIANQELILLNHQQCFFNENLVSQIQNLSDSDLLELFLISQNSTHQCLSKNIYINPNILNLQKYQPQLIEKLKYHISEKDILVALENIEKKSNTILQEKEKIFLNTSIQLNAVENLEDHSKNEAISIKGFRSNETQKIIINFQKDTCLKFLYKDLSNISKRELLQSLLIYDIYSKNIQESSIILHENIQEIEPLKPLIEKKLYQNISEEEIENYANHILSKFSNNLSPILNRIKHKLGFQKNLYQHLL
jgi:hypothetical protein